MAFPTSPTDGQTYTAPNGTVYKYVAADDSWIKDPNYGLVDEGTAFPSSPPDRMLFLRTDLSTMFMWSETAGAWIDVSSGGIYGGTSEGKRNYIHNGSMQISQRGTSFVAVNGVSLDRWNVALDGSPSITVNQLDTDAPDGFHFCYDIDNTTVPATPTIIIDQYIEGHDAHALRGNVVTLSFWVKSNKTGIACACLGAGGDLNYSIRTEFTIDAADTWEKKVLSFTVDDSSGSWDDTNGKGLFVGLCFAAASNYQATNNVWSAGFDPGTANMDNWADHVDNYVRFTGVQLEVGNAPTDFEHLTYAEELAICQRYFVKIGGEQYALLCDGYATTSEYHNEYYELPVTMRTEPTIVVNGATWSMSNLNENAPLQTSAGVNGFILYATITATGNFVWYALDSDDYVTAAADLI